MTYIHGEMAASEFSGLELSIGGGLFSESETQESSASETGSLLETGSFAAGTPAAFSGSGIVAGEGAN